jgi:hypothetical protein
MSYIDPDKRGYDRLFKYFDEYVNFEELIFASDSFYRDHTLHSLWVYFLGEYIAKDESFNVFLADKSYAKNVTASNKAVLESIKMDDIFGNVIKVYEKLLGFYFLEDSIRCITAITHDLGYPIKKIEKIINALRKYFHIFL